MRRGRRDDCSKFQKRREVADLWARLSECQTEKAGASSQINCHDWFHSALLKQKRLNELKSLAHRLQSLTLEKYGTFVFYYRMLGL